MLRFILTIAALLWAAVPGPATACGADSDCTIEGGRSYRISLPDAPTAGPIGAIVFAHGYGGSAAGVMRNRSLRRLASDLGVALIALDAGGQDWALPNAPHPDLANGVDDLDYVDRVILDAADRFGLDRNRFVATGFSAGAMLVWTLACERGDRFAGFIPVAGTFWAPVPQSCPSPAANLIHIHGTADRTVPLDGRAIGPARQGSVPDALAMYARNGGFGAARTQPRGDLDCRMRTNADGKALGFCQFNGGHSFRTGFIRQAWTMLVEAGQL